MMLGLALCYNCRAGQVGMENAGGKVQQKKGGNGRYAAKNQYDYARGKEPEHRD